MDWWFYDTRLPTGHLTRANLSPLRHYWLCSVVKDSIKPIWAWWTGQDNIKQRQLTARRLSRAVKVMRRCYISAYIGQASQQEDRAGHHSCSPYTFLKFDETASCSSWHLNRWASVHKQLYNWTDRSLARARSKWLRVTGREFSYDSIIGRLQLGHSYSQIPPSKSASYIFWLIIVTILPNRIEKDLQGSTQN